VGQSHIKAVQSYTRGPPQENAVEPNVKNHRSNNNMEHMTHEDGGWSHADIIEALLTSPTREAAAKRLGISRSTLYRWLRDEDLREAFRTARSDALHEGTTTLQLATYEAAAALRMLALDTNTNPHVRLGACRAILEFAYRATEVEDVRAQIEELKGMI
jgi:transposase-like protein